MSNVFNINRFGRYFMNELAVARRNAGLSLAIVSCMPVFVLVVYEFFALVFTGSFQPVHIIAIVASYIISQMIAVIAFPMRQYGKLTDRRAGSDWLLLPASGLEKYLSLLLVSCVVVPMVWIALMAGTDFLLSLIMPGYWEFGFPRFLGFYSDSLSLIGIHTSPALYVYSGLCVNILYFTLCAVVFRKNKVVWSFLVLWGIGMIMSVVMSGVLFAEIAQGMDVTLMNPADPEEMMGQISGPIATFTLILMAVEYVLLLCGLYYRIKTIKH